MDKTTLVSKNLYETDIPVLAAGVELIAHPCVVHEITVISDAAGDASVNFSDTATSYATASRLVKVKTTDENQTVQVAYPKGKVFSTGLCATANKGSVDVSVTYE